MSLHLPDRKAAQPASCPALLPRDNYIKAAWNNFDGRGELLHELTVTEEFKKGVRAQRDTLRMEIENTGILQVRSAIRILDQAVQLLLTHLDNDACVNLPVMTA